MWYPKSNMMPKWEKQRAKVHKWSGNILNRNAFFVWLPCWIFLGAGAPDPLIIAAEQDSSAKKPVNCLINRTKWLKKQKKYVYVDYPAGWAYI